MSSYARVILSIPNDDGFTYSVPEDMKNSLEPGMQVIVPFGKRFVSGIVIEKLGEISPELENNGIKPIRDIVHPQPVVSKEMIGLLSWISDYYICHLGEAYRLVQSGLNVGNSKLLLRRTEIPPPDNLALTQHQILEQIPMGGEIAENKLNKSIKRTTLRSVLLELEKSGLIERRYSSLEIKEKFKTEDFIRLILRDDRSEAVRQNYEKLMSGRSAKTKDLFNYLEGKGWLSMSDLKAKGFTRAAVNRLLSLDLVELESRPLHRSFHMPYHEPPPDIVITEDQQEFIDKASAYLEEMKFNTFLLHGITGSGKTQVYIELIRKVLEQGRQAIVLIPEIVLTPQTMARFQHYFKDRIGILHSRLSAGERREILHKVQMGEFDVVIGARSAIFAPVQNLGLVVVDEEHESSYKQSDAQPRYHARDVAIYRARLNNAVVVLGSATPSFESLYNARQGQFEYFQLMKRIESRSLPRISVVDLREEWKRGGEQPVISENLELKIESRLLTRDQIMILQNRRGYSPFILCKDCGYVAKCPNCDITLTFHQKNRQMVCHYCGYQEGAPNLCPDCQGMEILFRGIGTQRMEEVLLEKFPHASTLRMDQDTTKGKNGHLEILEKFRSGEADIMVGTKMIAKGLDFKRVSLVGIVSADQGLHFPDFRSTEKVFQLLTQAAGRAGRGASSGEVVVQTFDPSHYIFQYLLTHDYLNFFIKEIESRKSLKYPPFSRIMLIRVEGKNLSEVQKYSEVVRNFLRKANEQQLFSILGPSPAPIARIQNIYRYYLLVKQDKEKDASMSMLRYLVKKGLYQNPEVKKWPVKLSIDVDPVEIM
ncbi:MAG: primosomal protein N' [Calditrichia bacterium]